MTLNLVGTYRENVLKGVQMVFTKEFERYGKLNESDKRPMDYDRKQG